MDELTLMEIVGGSSLYECKVVPAVEQLRPYMEKPKDCRYAFENTKVRVSKAFQDGIRNQRKEPYFRGYTLGLNVFLESLVGDLEFEYHTLSKARNVFSPITSERMVNILEYTIRSCGVGGPMAKSRDDIILSPSGRQTYRQRMGRRKTDS